MQIHHHDIPFIPKFNISEIVALEEPPINDDPAFQGLIKEGKINNQGVFLSAGETPMDISFLASKMQSHLEREREFEFKGKTVQYTNLELLAGVECFSIVGSSIVSEFLKEDFDRIIPWLGKHLSDQQKKELFKKREDVDHRIQLLTDIDDLYSHTNTIIDTLQKKIGGRGDLKEERGLRKLGGTKPSDPDFQVMAGVDDHITGVRQEFIFHLFDLKNPYLSTADNVQLEVHMEKGKVVKMFLTATKRPWEEAIVHQALKIFHLLTPEDLNDRAWIKILGKHVKGWRCLSTKFGEWSGEEILLHKIQSSRKSFSNLFFFLLRENGIDEQKSFYLAVTHLVKLYDHDFDHGPFLHDMILAFGDKTLNGFPRFIYRLLCNYPIEDCFHILSGIHFETFHEIQVERRKYCEAPFIQVVDNGCCFRFFATEKPFCLDEESCSSLELEVAYRMGKKDRMISSFPTYYRKLKEEEMLDHLFHFYEEAGLIDANFKEIEEGRIPYLFAVNLLNTSFWQEGVSLWHTLPDPIPDIVQTFIKKLLSISGQLGMRELQAHIESVKERRTQIEVFLAFYPSIKTLPKILVEPLLEEMAAIFSKRVRGIDSSFSDRVSALISDLMERFPYYTVLLLAHNAQKRGLFSIVEHQDAIVDTMMVCEENAPGQLTKLFDLAMQWGILKINEKLRTFFIDGLNTLPPSKEVQKRKKQIVQLVPPNQMNEIEKKLAFSLLIEREKTEPFDSLCEEIIETKTLNDKEKRMFLLLRFKKIRKLETFFLFLDQELAENLTEEHLDHLHALGLSDFLKCQSLIQIASNPERFTLSLSLSRKKKEVLCLQAYNFQQCRKNIRLIKKVVLVVGDWESYIPGFDREFFLRILEQRDEEATIHLIIECFSRDRPVTDIDLLLSIYTIETQVRFAFRNQKELLGQDEKLVQWLRQVMQGIRPTHELVLTLLRLFDLFSLADPDLFQEFIQFNYNHITPDKLMSMSKILWDFFVVRFSFLHTGCRDDLTSLHCNVNFTMLLRSIYAPEEVIRLNRWINQEAILEMTEKNQNKLVKYYFISIDKALRNRTMHKETIGRAERYLKHLERIAEKTFPKSVREGEKYLVHFKNCRINLLLILTQYQHLKKKYWAQLEPYLRHFSDWQNNALETLFNAYASRPKNVGCRPCFPTLTLLRVCERLQRRKNIAKNVSWLKFIQVLVSYKFVLKGEELGEYTSSLKLDLPRLAADMLAVIIPVWTDKRERVGELLLYGCLLMNQAAERDPDHCLEVLESLFKEHGKEVQKYNPHFFDLPLKTCQKNSPEKVEELYIRMFEIGGIPDRVHTMVIGKSMAEERLPDFLKKVLPIADQDERFYANLLSIVPTTDAGCFSLIEKKLIQQDKNQYYKLLLQLIIKNTSHAISWLKHCTLQDGDLITRIFAGILIDEKHLTKDEFLFLLHNFFELIHPCLDAGDAKNSRHLIMQILPSLIEILKIVSDQRVIFTISDHINFLFNLDAKLGSVLSQDHLNLICNLLILCVRDDQVAQRTILFPSFILAVCNYFASPADEETKTSLIVKFLGICQKRDLMELFSKRVDDEAFETKIAYPSKKEWIHDQLLHWKSGFHLYTCGKCREEQ